MQDRYQHIAQIILKHLKGTLSESEAQELTAWIAESNENKLIFDRSTNKEEFEADWNLFFHIDAGDQEAAKQKIWQLINADNPVRQMHSSSINWWKYAVAAVILFCVMAGAWKYYYNAPADKTARQLSGYSNKETLPDSVKVVLTLADGSQINLDEVPDGVLSLQGNATIVKEPKSLVYQTAQVLYPGETLYNTISTRRGGQYHVVLPDGSDVWLNATSSIRFPTVFKGNIRKVEITGEAYFAIERDPRKPFRVSIQPVKGIERAEVEVLGTHFNVNAYEDEPIMYTTLVEGSVKVKKGNDTRILKPSQQAQMNNINRDTLPLSRFSKNPIQVVSNVDIEKTIAWKDEFFYFKNDDINTVIRQVERWYNVKVEKRMEVKIKFTSEINRSLKVNEFLKVLFESEVPYRMEGNKIILGQ
jgi:transmembrane sensor